MYKTYSMELAGRTLTVEIGRVAAQANGAALMRSWIFPALPKPTAVVFWNEESPISG